MYQRTVAWHVKKSWAIEINTFPCEGLKQSWHKSQRNNIWNLQKNQNKIDRSLLHNNRFRYRIIWKWSLCLFNRKIFLHWYNVLGQCILILMSILAIVVEVLKCLKKMLIKMFSVSMVMHILRVNRKCEHGLMRIVGKWLGNIFWCKANKKSPKTVLCK